jgi:DNA-binding HxlR family transcriptional regulator
MPTKSKLPKRRSECPTSSFLDLLGDRWTLLVLRDLLMKGHSRYSALADSKERIPSNLLAQRLKSLEGAGLLRREAYQVRPMRYEYLPTRAAVDLLDVIAQMAKWSNSHLKGTKEMPPSRYAAAKADWLKRLEKEA